MGTPRRQGDVAILISPHYEEEENDDGVCCQLCDHRPGDTSECGTCHLNMCASCMPLHLVPYKTEWFVHRYIGIPS